MIPDHVYERTLREFLAPVAAFLDDASVSEIMINGPSAIFVERAGLIERTDARFPSHEALWSALRNVAQFAGKQVDERHQILEARLPDGSRLQAVMPPAAPDGPYVAIRRFFKQTLTMTRLIEFGALDELAAATLHCMVEAKLNMMIAGGTGSGKTSMLNALTGYIPAGQRVVVIEDSKEVQPQFEHAVQLEARPPDDKGRGQVTVRDLFRASLRMRPDRLIIGEVRGGEALDIIQAMTSGHGGCMGTLHATYPRDTLSRLETMCMMGDIEMPLAAMRTQIGSGIDIIVQVARLRDGSRVLTHITEVQGIDPESSQYLTQDIIRREFTGLDQAGRVQSALVPTGVLPRCLPQLKEHGVDLPAPIYRAHEGSLSRD